MTAEQSSAHETAFPLQVLPKRLCNFDRLLGMLEHWKLDGVVLSTEKNVLYLTSFNPIAHKGDEPRPYAVVFSRHDPEHPILLVADYYLGHFLHQPTWVEDLRPIRAVMLPLDLPPQEDDLERFIPQSGQAVPWVQQARTRYEKSLVSGCQHALRELGLSTGRVAFDDLRLGQRAAPVGVDVVDGYDVMMQTRRVKTDDELQLLRTATALNQQAISRTVASWEPGVTWRQIGQAYHQAATELGGFVHDPGGLVLAHPRGMDPSVSLQTGTEDFELAPGTHVMFDCHGTWNQYCWDGGKTWIVDGEPQGTAKLTAAATAEAMRVILEKMRPGVRISELQQAGRDVYRRMGAARPESVLIFFHGLGLSHMDLEELGADGTPTRDWALEAGMVVPVHLLYPGGEQERVWLEEVALVQADGAEPFFTWGFEPLTGK